MRDEHTYAIIGAAMEVHRELGHGFLEAASELWRPRLDYKRLVLNLRKKRLKRVVVGDGFEPSKA